MGRLPSARPENLSLITDNSRDALTARTRGSSPQAVAAHRDFFPGPGLPRQRLQPDRRTVPPGWGRGRGGRPPGPAVAVGRVGRPSGHRPLPMVEMCEEWNSLSVKRHSRQVLPTPESPISSSRNSTSYCFAMAGAGAGRRAAGGRRAQPRSAAAIAARARRGTPRAARRKPGRPPRRPRPLARGRGARRGGSAGGRRERGRPPPAPSPAPPPPASRERGRGARAGARRPHGGGRAGARRARFPAGAGTQPPPTPV